MPREAERVAGAATGCSILSPQVAERHRLVEVDAERVQAGPVTLRNANAPTRACLLSNSTGGRRGVAAGEVRGEIKSCWSRRGGRQKSMLPRGINNVVRKNIKNFQIEF